ncbi:MAG: nitrile hydratase subunit beta [Candidatus Rokubacteria bacterium]|nr:nitrile hydratase subunit beta [Candidatus Rokubacteria bacterium]
MNGVHDMGGMHGLGPVEPEPDEPVFHTEWERRAFAITLAAGFLGEWNIDMSRYSRELMPGPEILTTTYYEHWLWGLEHLLVEKGLATRDEIAGRVKPARPSKPLRVLKAAEVAAAIAKGGAHRVNDDVPARFKVGDRVRTRNINPLGHTRLPRYARDKHGVVDRDHGVHVFPDAHAAGLGQKPQHVYSVRFTMQELWGPDASARDRAYIDLWDDYLEPA